MVKSGSHCLDKMSERDHLMFFSPDISHKMDPIMEELSLHESHSFGASLFYDSIANWLEESYLTISVVKNKFHPYLELNMYVCMLEKCLQGIHFYHPIYCGKFAGWIKQAFKAHLYACSLEFILTYRLSK